MMGSTTQSTAATTDSTASRTSPMPKVSTPRISAGIASATAITSTSSTVSWKFSDSLAWWSVKGCSSRLNNHTRSGPTNPKTAAVARPTTRPPRWAAIAQPRSSELSPEGWGWEGDQPCAPGSGGGGIAPPAAAPVVRKVPAVGPPAPAAVGAGPAAVAPGPAAVAPVPRPAVDEVGSVASNGAPAAGPAPSDRPPAPGASARGTAVPHSWQVGVMVSTMAPQVGQVMVVLLVEHRAGPRCGCLRCGLQSIVSGPARRHHRGPPAGDPETPGPGQGRDLATSRPRDLASLST